MITHRGHKLTQQQLNILTAQLNRMLNHEITQDQLNDELDDALEAAGCPVPLDPPNYRPWAGEERVFRGVLKIRQQMRDAAGEWMVEDGHAKWEWVIKGGPDDRLAQGEPW